MSSKTPVAKAEDISRDWYLVDASDMVLGRLAAQVASRLRGKHKPIFSPHMDTGDFVVVVNAEKVKLTGRKMDQKMYWRHSGYPGGIKGRHRRPPPAGDQAGAGVARRGARHAAQESFGTQDAEKAQNIHRPRASASGPATPDSDPGSLGGKL